MFAAGKTATPSGGGPDAQFNYVTMLLHGDGTNGAQNNTFVDSSTNNFTITRNGNTTQGSFSPYGSNWSNNFPAGSSYLDTPSSSELTFGTGNFTIEFWINTNITDFNIMNPSSATGSGYWGLLFQSGNLRWNDAYNTTNLFAISASAILNGAWHHVAICRASGTTNIYFDGVAQAPQTDTTNYSGVAAWRIGLGNVSGGGFNGYLSNFRVNKGTAVYTSNFTPSTTNLTAISGTSLLTCQNNRFIDNSPNGFALTTGGTPSVQRFNPFGASTAYDTSVIGGSGYFDGSGDYLSTPNSSSFAFGTGNFTVEFWYRGTDTGGGFGLTTGGSTGYWQLNLSSGTMYWQNDVGVSNLLSVSASPILNNAWNHVAVVRNSTTLTIYFNGVSVTSTSDSTNYSGTGGDFQLGLDSNVNYITGYIADYRIVKGTAVYTANFTPPNAPLTAVTNTQLLLKTTNGAIFDNAMMNDLETVGNAQISTSVKKYGTGSLAFDGTGDRLVGPATPNMAFGTGNYTIEFWCYPSNTGYGCFIDTRSANPSTNGVSIFNNGTDLEVYSDTLILSASGAFTLNTWQHFALARSGTSLKAFVNGTQVGSTATNSDNQTAGRVMIGDNIGVAYPLNGYIDDLRITKGYARYTATFTPPTSALSDTGPY